MTDDVPKRRRWFQFRLQTLLVVTTLISVAMSLWLWHRQLKAEVADRYTTFQQALASKEFERAFECMSPQYRNDHSLQEFIAVWDGRLYALQSEGLIWVTPTSASIHPFPVEFFEIVNGEIFYLVKENGQWYFTGEAFLSLD